MKVTIVSPERTLFTGEASSVLVPGTKGRFEILNHHGPIISTLSAGTVRCTADETFEVEVSGGFVEMHDNEVSVCVETA